MKKISFITTSIFFVFVVCQVFANNIHLTKAYQQQVKSFQNQYLTLYYKEVRNEFGHTFKPWDLITYSSSGCINCNNDSFTKVDTLISRNIEYYSKTMFNNEEMLLLNYGQNNLASITNTMFLNRIINTARYTPTMLISYFIENKIDESEESNNQFAVYKTNINKTVVKIYIDKTNNLVHQILTLHDDDLYGDVLNSYFYAQYNNYNDILVPQSIKIEKLNGKISDDVNIIEVGTTPILHPILEKPTDYKIVEDKQTNPEIITEKYNDNIYFVNLLHTDSRAVIVEFDNFLLVAEAPINSQNGELIISEAKNIAPDKPIKYFVFGHFHNYYLGGLRPFVHNGTTILCINENIEYVKFLVDAQRTLNPDSLQIKPKPLLIEEIKDSIKITDGTYEMFCYVIGEKSKHTYDFLIFYFPAEKLLFQGDLVWIPNNDELKKASPRQVGLYNSIIDLGIEVDTIIQSWPLNNYNVKNIISFKDLETSINIE